MAIARLVRDNRGIALITVLLVALAVSSMAIAASLLTLNGTLIRRYSERAAVTDQAALSGVEEGLSALRANPSLVPVSGFTTIEDSVPVLDASGVAIPGVFRWTYVGPSSDRARASIVSRASAEGGGVALRRMEVTAKSFAQYGMLIGSDPTGQGFRPSDKMFGPVHFNTTITVDAPSGADSATFWQRVTSTHSITGIGNGVFRDGYGQNEDAVAFPNISTLDALRPLAVSATLRFNTSIGDPNGAMTRLEFIAIDMDDDPLVEDIQGFVRVYTNSNGSNMPFVMGWQTGSEGAISTPNCGVVSGTNFLRYPAQLSLAQARDSVDANRYQCFLGGDPAMNPTSGEFLVNPPGSGPTSGGTYVQWTGPAVAGPPSFMARLDRQYLHPYTPGVNPNAAGVIFVDGEVGVSGVVAGKVTVVATDDIVMVDDLVQYTDPGAADCDRDILGLIAGDDFIIADNTLMTPQRYGSGAAYHTMGQSKDEYLHAVVMALNQGGGGAGGSFRVQDATLGPSSGDNGGLGAEPCEGVPMGRGCFYLTGGIITQERGLFGDFGRGYRLRSSFNSCVEEQAPPQFPTTDEYRKARVFEMSPADFDPATWYNLYQM